ncbi:MAG: [Fe-Fe] hydrogenase large subunit C-terminal domain-containing protein [Clostridiaceae bacterium]|nr:[Fe-Fe] hydrogenase large subunit C-terminal domain-containing protein [Clostridiaceae bacterium]
MEPVIRVAPAECKNCYKCIRNCSVKAIACLNDKTNIIDDECIYCGRCLLECPHHARSIISELDIVKKAIRRGEKLYVSLAPSYIAAFPGASILELSAALKQLGFTHVEETAIGADRVTREYENLMRQGKMPNIITTSCVSVNLLIEKYYPSLVPSLAPVQTPAVAHARMLKQIYANRAKVVFIGPCAAKKFERQENRELFAVLTFSELAAWLKEEGIKPDRQDQEGKALKNTIVRFYPAPGGIIRNLGREERRLYECVDVDGPDRCIQILDSIVHDKLTGFFLEMNICPGGCLGGPVLQQMGVSFLGARDRLIKNALKLNEAPATMTEGIPVDLAKTFHDRSRHQAPFSEEAIREVLASVGKLTPDQELNCGCCGYRTCREKAEAVLRGKADIQMCVPHMREMAESMANTVVEHTPTSILILDDKLVVKQINPSARELLHITDQTVGSPAADLWPDLDLPDLLREAPVIRRRLTSAGLGLILEISVVSVQYSRTVFLLINDVTNEERLRESRRKVTEETAQVARSVLNRQMQTVQEIAGLLGETTADAKSALSRLIRSIESETADNGSMTGKSG